MVFSCGLVVTYNKSLALSDMTRVLCFTMLVVKNISQVMELTLEVGVEKSKVKRQNILTPIVFTAEKADFL